MHGHFFFLRRVGFGTKAKWLEDARAIASNRATSLTAPIQDLERRLFVGNLPTDHMTREEMEEIFSKYGKIRG